ncbi:glycosyltransferase family 2 protein [Thioclava sp. GXIMD4215]|uniref:glycosyltransferase family 2 protein n=1 Tax=Thioclava sp. GXIMD4215 TaxID=3131928 RepID=UPI00324D86B8
MKLRQLYKLRWERKKFLFRAFRKRRELSCLADRTRAIRTEDILVFVTLRNERIRLPYFLRYYREMGCHHFIIVDNGSDDGSREYLETQPDVSLWHTKASYKGARFGMDWVNHLLRRYGTGHWCLTVDPDEFFVYPFCDTRTLDALTDWLDTYDIPHFPAMLLDMYPKGRLEEQPYEEGQNPFEIACWFDSGNYTITKNRLYQNLWIQGGPRARKFFASAPAEAPSLNKIPLIRWQKNYVYISSTHMALPRGLNTVYDEWGGEKPSGCLLHAKFLSVLNAKVTEEITRKQHYSASREYKAYAEVLAEDGELWCRWSERYINWRQLEILGLMSKGNWA